MKLDIESLRDHYASLSDEALAELDTSGLVEEARQLYDQECERRPGVLQAFEDPESMLEYNRAGRAEWLEDALCVHTIVQYPGQARADEAARCCDALRAADILCHLDASREEMEAHPGHYMVQFRILVPGEQSLHAMSVLDRDVYNAVQEEEWRAHFSALSGEALGALDPDIFCAGLLDRAARLRRAYEEEVARRREPDEEAE